MEYDGITTFRIKCQDWASFWFQAWHHGWNLGHHKQSLMTDGLNIFEVQLPSRFGSSPPTYCLGLQTTHFHTSTTGWLINPILLEETPHDLTVCTYVLFVHCRSFLSPFILPKNTSAIYQSLPQATIFPYMTLNFIFSHLSCRYSVSDSEVSLLLLTFTYSRLMLCLLWFHMLTGS